MLDLFLQSSFKLVLSLAILLIGFEHFLFERFDLLPLHLEKGKLVLLLLLHTLVETFVGALKLLKVFLFLRSLQF